MPEGATFTLIADLVERDGDFRWKAAVRFLVPEARHEKLMPGTKFEFYEGRRCVARGEVVKV